MITKKIYNTQFAIDIIKTTFEKLMKKYLNFIRVSAPLFLDINDKLNDNLATNEQPVSFYVKSLNKHLEIVQSLAKWKRVALKKYGFETYQGFYTNMNAIRPNDLADSTHSIYVDQYDWEMVINEKDYNLDFLYNVVNKFYKCIKQVNKLVNKMFDLKVFLPKKIHFITSESLYKLYPNLTRKAAEYEIVKKHKAVFISQIGDYITNTNIKHDERAKDYDHWKLNGDLLVYHQITDIALELMSMGIRVNSSQLIYQCNLTDLKNINNQYYLDIINNNLPLCIGGGLGQSRLCMFLLNKKHIGEVQVSVWNDDELKELL